MRLLICAGGTGGGVYPALAVLQALESEAHTVLWVGGHGGMEAELVGREGVDYVAIPAAGVHGVGLRALAGNLVQLARGFHQARKLLRQYRPEVLFFTGGYVAAPVALAGRRLPTLIFVPDIEPGLAMKILARFADHIAVSADSARAYYPAGAPLTVTGYPVRAGLTDWERASARQALGLMPDLPTLLVVGGSQGARSINRAVKAALPDLLAEMQIVHLTGRLDWAELEAARDHLSQDQAARYRPFPYLHEEMGAAFAAADLVLSRAGASALGEFPRFGLPAVVVPYPHAWRYQRVNAGYLVARGAALMIADANLATQLTTTVRGLMGDPGLREQMGAAMRSLSHPEAARDIAHLLTTLASDPDKRGSAKW